MNRFARVVTLLVGASLAAGIALATPASATAIKTGHGSIDSDGLSLGNTINTTTGKPKGKADFEWQLVNGVTSVHVTGEFGATGRSGVTVHLSVRYFTSTDGSGDPMKDPAVNYEFTPSSDSSVVKTVNWTPAGEIGAQSAKICVASDPDHDGEFVRESCLTSNIL
jgi:hypothetical protein